MKRSLNTREKRLLYLCLGVVFLVVNIWALSEFTKQRRAVTATISELSEEATTNEVLLTDQPYWEKRLNWVNAHMPFTDSLGKSQGQLLEYLQTSSRDSELSITSQTLLEPLKTQTPDQPNEVAVTVRVRGDQEKMLRWLLTLQSPEKFQAVKAIDLELDSRSREKTPQAQCNLTIARWFNPLQTGSSDAAPVVPANATPSPAPVTFPTPSPSTPAPNSNPTPPAPGPDQQTPVPPANPLELQDPLEIQNPSEILPS